MAATSPGRIRELASRAGLAVVATVLALGIGELVTRQLYPQLGWRAFQDDLLGWAGLEYKWFDPKREAKTDRRRLLVLGDSFVAGAGVSSLDERFPSVLADSLRTDLEVAIFATAGWGTDQELLAFVQKGKAWRPDLVVLAFCANNDISNNLSNRRQKAGRKPYFVTDEQGLRLYTAEGQLMSDWGRQYETTAPWQLFIWDLFRYHLTPGYQEEPVRAKTVPPRYKLFGEGADPLSEIARLEPRLSWSPQLGVNHVSAYIHDDFKLNTYQWQLFEAIVTRLRLEAEEISAEVVLMLLPVAFKAGDLRFVAGADFGHRFETPKGEFLFRMDEPRRRLQRVSEAAGVRLFDPTSRIIDRIEREGALEAAWPTHGLHFAAPVHRMLAEELAEYLDRDLDWEPPAFAEVARDPTS